MKNTMDPIVLLVKNIKTYDAEPEISYFSLFFSIW